MKTNYEHIYVHSTKLKKKWNQISKKGGKLGVRKNFLAQISEESF